jgi:hypothetical protein
MDKGCRCKESKPRFAVLVAVFLLLISACAEQPTAPPSAPKAMDDTTMPQVDATISPIATHDALAEDLLPPKPAHVETERERKERLYWENQKNPNYHHLGVPIFIYTDSNGRKWMDVPADTVDVEVKE